MGEIFTEAAIDEIAKVLNCAWKYQGNNYRLVVEDPATDRRLVLEIYPNIKIGDRVGNLISVNTKLTQLQLHFCTGYVVSELLGEVTFYSEANGKVSGLVVERVVGCAMYANVDRSVLSGDFTNLGPEVWLSGIALSLTEHVLNSSKEVKS
ncbi:MAG: hypothetical protein ONB13_12390 [candidate division KSB1 bacterium]|nr:hypothetical protein [candidate division KSB1 bacterium]MDZ7357556.1 hypothetical protein [candidate division KSB1 bacterium]MDZ7377403.1 hypothetical protein [candidate division KSB1 bacterium]MDZ7400531.1 hypothetical protein [candidate division KSB1 bacterium]